MRRLFIALGVLVLLVVLVLAGGYIALQRIDWNQYKEPVAQAAFDATGRKLDLSGDIDLEIGLEPGVSVAGVAFENAEWGSRPQMASVERFVVRLELLPLLSGKIVVSRVELIGLDLSLETNAEGLQNWAFEAPVKEDEPAAVEPEPAPPTPGEEDTETPTEAPAYSTLVRHAEIQNAVVVIRDESTGAEQRIAVERLLATSEGEEGPLTLDLAAEYDEASIRLTGTIDGVQDVMGGGPLGLDLTLEVGGAKIDLDGTVGEPLEGSGLDLKLVVAGDTLADMEVVAKSEVPDLGPYRLALALQGGGDAYAVRDLALKVGSTELTGTIDANLAGNRPRVAATLASPRIALADFQDDQADPDSEPAEAEAEAAASSAKATTGSAGSESERLFSAEPLALDGLAAADATLSLDVKELDLGTLLLAALDLDLKLENSNLQVKKLAGDLASGHFDFAVGLNASKKTPQLVVKSETRGIVIGELLESQGVDMLANGPLDLDIDLTGNGGSVRALMASLNGSFGLQMGAAHLDDSTAALVLADAASLLSADKASKGAEVSCMWANFTVRNGVAKPEGIVVDLGSMALFGDGKIDLRDETLNLSFDRQSLSASAAGLLPPFEVKGTLAQPKGAIDAGALASRALDLGSSLLSGKERTQTARPAGCEALLAQYRADIEARESESVTGRAADVIGETTGETGKKVVDSLKGLFGR